MGDTEQGDTAEGDTVPSHAGASEVASRSDPTRGATLLSLEDPGSVDAALGVLADGEVEVLGRMPHASNSTFLTRVERGDVATAAIYKPVRGERPLWDFPAGLARREVASFELSDAMGWHVIPPTIERGGPHGTGSLQLFIDADFRQHYFTLAKEPELQANLRQICLFDLVANNTDRKSGHCLLARWGRVYGIDQGLCFAEDFKLRTVIWDFAGEPFNAAELAALDGLRAGPPERVTRWLTDGETEALRDRARRLAGHGAFPDDRVGHGWPWPLV